METDNEKNIRQAISAIAAVFVPLIVFAVLSGAGILGVVGAFCVSAVFAAGMILFLLRLAKQNVLSRIQPLEESLQNTMESHMSMERQAGSLAEELQKLTAVFFDSFAGLKEKTDAAVSASDKILEEMSGWTEGAADQQETFSAFAAEIDAALEAAEEMTGRVQKIKEKNSSLDSRLKRLSAGIQEERTLRETADRQIRRTDDCVAEFKEEAAFVTDLASQIDLLALNASIEAVRAKDAGKGFSVVASEIRALANQSGEYADRVSKLVRILSDNSRQSVQMAGRAAESAQAGRAGLSEISSGTEERNREISSLERREQEVFSEMKEASGRKAGIESGLWELRRSVEKAAGDLQNMASLLGELKSVTEICDKIADDLKHVSFKWGEISKQKVIM